MLLPLFFVVRSSSDRRCYMQGILRHPVLPLRLLPLVRHLQQLRHLGRRLVVGGEDVIHVLLEAVVVELPPLLDLAGHLLVDFFNVRRGAVGAFEGFPGVEEGDALEDLSADEDLAVEGVVGVREGKGREGKGR